MDKRPMRYCCFANRNRDECVKKKKKNVSDAHEPRGQEQAEEYHQI